MKLMIKLVFVLGLGLILASCVPVVKAHYVLSFEGVAGIKVKEKRRLVQREIIMNWAVPVRYVLERETYILYFMISEITLSSNIIVSVVSRNGQHIKIAPHMDRSSYAPSGGICATYDFENSRHDALFFSWPNACSDYEEKMRLSFELIGADGSIMGKEVLPFEMKWDGFVYYIDSL